MTAVAKPVESSAPESSALSVIEQPPVGAKSALRLLRPVAAPAEIVEAQNEMRAMVHHALKDGRDFGTIPGTNKPTLLKPGAERVALGFGCYYGQPIIVEKEIDHDRHVEWSKRKKQWKNRFQGDRDFDWIDEAGASLGLYRYVVRVQVINRETGQVVGEGIGACSTMESKYIDRPRDSENTVLKMAHKRAIVAACLVTFGLSDEFTQDVEDLGHLNGGEQQAAQPRQLTLEDARKFPFPWTQPAKYVGKTLADITGRMLENVYIGTKKAIASKGESVYRAETLQACELLLKAKGVDPATVSEKKEEKKADASDDFESEPASKAGDAARDESDLPF